MTFTVPIPEPSGWPLLGNILDIDFELPIRSLCSLAEKHGEIYRMRFPGQTFVVVSSYALINEICDEKRFHKSVQALRASTEETNWGIAHRVLMPAFGPALLHVMFDGMYDIASQLALKWARYGETTPIMVTEDFTRLTLDTIALCAMDFRFNSYYKDEMHPFVEAMSGFLTETGNRASRLPLPSIFYRGKDQKFFSDIDVLRRTADEVLQARKDEGNLDKRKDLLSVMLNGVDSVTGQKLSDESILDNLITFLIAGHETTSGLLSFAFYYLMTYPKVYEKAKQEIDEVCGRGPIRYEHLSKLSYIEAVLRETLRLQPTIPVFNIAGKKNEILGGRYSLPAEELVIVLLAKSHLDPKVYGEDFDEFKPERMLGENFNRLSREFPNCWKPFGNGARACIGRPFAWQEALLVTAMLLQNFDFVLDDPDYSLALKQTLTIKPQDLRMRATLREGLTAIELEQKLAGTSNPLKSDSSLAMNGATAAPGETHEGKLMTIFYGSNSGTCQSLAERLAANAFSHGFRASLVDCMDNAEGKLPFDEPAIFITASYEGQPPDNASRFVGWLEKEEGKQPCKGVHYAVFGCGHRDWASTFHRVPKLVDSLIEKLGGSRIAPLGLCDVATGNIFTDFETWEDDVLWPAMMERYNAVPPEGPALSLEVSGLRKSALRQDVKEAHVLGNSTLTHMDASGRKQKMEIQLPAGVTYEAGDYLAVLPFNSRDSVDRVMRHFHLTWDAHLTISANSLTSLPENTPTPAMAIFSAYVELGQPATKRNLLTLADAAQDGNTKLKLQSMATDDLYISEISSKRLSVLDLLESNPSINLPLSAFLGMLPPMRTRQYSISSSPLWNPNRVVLTYSVGRPCQADDAGRIAGVATTYMSSLEKGDMLQVSVRRSHAGFRLPPSGSSHPIIMVAAGTGIAPFRGFVQEWAELRSGDQSNPAAMLFFGCRDPEKDDLYREDFDEWESKRVVSVWRAYSRRTEASKGCKYVQDRLWKERHHVMDAWNRGANIYVCGSQAVGEAVKNVFIDIFLEAASNKGKKTSREDMRLWFDGLKNTRYAVDVFD
ncbi:Bifunctional P-450:NADPH-P450 reductase 5 [Colletotrichum chlorophyti]|uniref:Bifunctional cytochrome P450/NADPH--P450 reductase n=1 Tax=Colletotrichum chlorophyti TaxID=708187 RepID=A0A1Q8RZP4_9PEZI|nr:Bifunctional P-450:NADPH-P450 reductase 5 [Colletotrichum chlorophyti]